MSDAARTLEPSLDDRYELERGRIFLTGTQALTRLMIEQQRRDARAGLRTASFVTGYPGSPLSGLDIVLHGAANILQRHAVRHAPAQNEESAAGALMGTQMLDQHPHPDVDGVNGYWYGKGPGLDRAGDAIKHGNFAGTSKLGAVVILSGEDHEAKSSTVPYQQEFYFEHAGIPVLYPASVAEFLEYGLHAVAMSRYSGCWVALKLVGSLCDGGETVEVDPQFPTTTLPAREVTKPLGKAAKFVYFPGFNINTEQNLYYERHDAVRAYARANALDRIVVKSKHDRIGIVAAGKSFSDTMRALRGLGFDDDALNAAGIRLLKVGLLCPIEPETIREFAHGLNDIIVVEEKRDFLERQIGRIVCDLDAPVRLFGKSDQQGKPLFPVHGAMDFDFIAGALGRILAERVTLPEVAQRRTTALASIANRTPVTAPRRSLNFCSGCPHNIGVRLAEGQVAWGSPGCHIFAALSPEPTRRIDAVMQFGGEGLPWIGLAPFTSRKHIVQNVGDGGLFHSAYLNIRQAVSAGVSMTFKILYNGAIANTGGQEAVSARTIPEIANLLATDRVLRIAIVTKERRTYRGVRLPSNTIVREPSDMEAVLKDFETVQGVTVVIYDGQCANERRRRQKRGKAPMPTQFTIVHEDVCENCGACGEVANCMSLQKVDTEFGPKTRIHQSSCNQDQTCVTADCPSFITVRTKPAGGVRKPALPAIDATLPEPQQPTLERPYHIYSPGVGGTGVITANAILGQAATLDGNRALSFDQTGAAQKWGAVLSSLIIAKPDQEVAGNAIGRGQADLYLAFDLLAAADANNLSRCSPERTVAVINSAVLPTSEMVRNVRLIVPTDSVVASILAVTDAKRSFVSDARMIAETMFGDYMTTNMVLIGAAYQRGHLPISVASIETAIRMNKVAVEANIQAFRAGRLTVCDPKRLPQTGAAAPGTFADRIAEARRRPNAARSAAADRLMTSMPALDGETADFLRKRIEDIIDYQNIAYATRYADRVRKTIAIEQAATGGAAVARAVMRNLHKLMTYKDEYEVARLLIQDTFKDRARAAFAPGSKFYYNLQPPLLRAFGLKDKVALGSWFTPALRALAMLRTLRGTAFDPFGYAAVRRCERNLIDWYEKLLDSALPALTAANEAVLRQIVNLPDDIRGYEDLKLRSAKAAQQSAQTLLGQLTPPPSARMAAE